MGKKKKIGVLILHNHYQQAGGEDAVAAGERALLREHGHEVHLHSVSNDAIQGLWVKTVTAWRTPYSQWGRRETTRIINETAPDIVHVHNFFPLLSPSVYDACLDAGVPVVQTLHNYRTICPGSLLMRDGKLCEDCIQGTPYQGALHGCYRDSRLGSLAVARMVDTHRRRGTWENKVDRFIALTEFARGKFVQAGFPAQKIVVKPNFVEAAEPGPPADAEGESSEGPRWGAFSYPNYRRYWISMVARVFGLQFRFIGTAWLVFVELDRSPIWLGVVGLASALPTIILSVPAGVVADRFDTRRILVLSQSATALLTFLMAVLVVTGAIDIWIVIGWSIVVGALAALANPAQSVILPRLIDMSAMASAAKRLRGLSMVTSRPTLPRSRPAPGSRSSR